MLTSETNKNQLVQQLQKQLQQQLQPEPCSVFCERASLDASCGAPTRQSLCRRRSSLGAAIQQLQQHGQRGATDLGGPVASCNTPRRGAASLGRRFLTTNTAAGSNFQRYGEPRVMQSQKMPTSLQKVSKPSASSGFTCYSSSWGQQRRHRNCFQQPLHRQQHCSQQALPSAPQPCQLRHHQHCLEQALPCQLRCHQH